MRTVEIQATSVMTWKDIRLFRLEFLLFTKRFEKQVVKNSNVGVTDTLP